MVILTATDALVGSGRAAALNRLRYRAPKRRGPSRRQVLAGYLVPAEIDETGKRCPEVWVEGQVPRAVRELGRRLDDRPGRGPARDLARRPRVPRGTIFELRLGTLEPGAEEEQ